MTAPTTSTRSRRRQFAGLLLLTAIAASSDAISYIHLDVFPANMTGNTVLLAIGLGTGDGTDAAMSGLALAGFVFGAAASGWAHGHTALDRKFYAVSVGVEAALLAAVVGLWAANGAAEGTAATYATIPLLSAAMGVQSATVRGLHAGVSTTYITGTWTAVSAYAGGFHRTAAARKDHSPHRLQAAVLVCYFAVALLAAAINHAVT